MWVQVILAILQAAPQFIAMIPQIIKVIAEIEKAFPGAVLAALNADPENPQDVVSKVAAHVASTPLK